MATKGKNHAWILDKVKKMKEELDSIETVLTEKVQENKEKAIKSQKNKS